MTHIQELEDAVEVSPHGRKRSLPGLSRLVAMFGFPLAGVVAVIIALLLGVGANPVETFNSLLNGSVGSAPAIGETLLRAAPLILIAVTLAPALRARMFNLGAPGQMAMGATAATAFALWQPTLPSWVLIPVCAVLAALAGLLVAAIPAAMKAWWDANEIITSIAMNFISYYILLYLLGGPMEASVASIPQSNGISERAWLPIAMSGTRANWGLLLGVVAVAALFLVDHTRLGYRQKLFAANPLLSRQAGVHPRRTIFAVLVTAGAGAGLAGWLQVAGVDHRLYSSVSHPVGYAGLFVALLGGTSAAGMLIAALLMGALLQGGDTLQLGVGLPPEIVQVFIGLVLLGYAVASRRRGDSE